MDQKHLFFKAHPLASSFGPNNCPQIWWRISPRTKISENFKISALRNAYWNWLFVAQSHKPVLDILLEMLQNPLAMLLQSARFNGRSVQQFIGNVQFNLKKANEIKKNEFYYLNSPLLQILDCFCGATHLFGETSQSRLLLVQPVMKHPITELFQFVQ